MSLYSLPLPLKHQGLKIHHHVLPGGERISLRGHRWKEKKMLLWYFPSGKHRRRWQKLFVCHVLLLCGKCCSSLPTLPGAHPVFEILNMRIVPLCSDETMMIHSFWNVLYVLFIWFFFFFDYSFKMACTTFFGWFWVQANSICCNKRILI